MLINQYLAVWHALKVDRAQRDILEAAAREARIIREYETEIGKKLLAEIVWINGQANTIEDKRNDALHSPLWGSGNQVAPLSGLGHKRARKLVEAGTKRGLLVEFRWCRDATLALTDYIRDINDCLSGSARRPWPERPSPPSRGQTRKTSPHRQKSQAKPAPLPQTSRA
jgi:hypothetical protein